MYEPIAVYTASREKAWSIFLIWDPSKWVGASINAPLNTPLS